MRSAWRCAPHRHPRNGVARHRSASPIGSFSRHGLREHGHVEGRALVFGFPLGAWASGPVAAPPHELVRRVDVIVTAGTPAAAAAVRATSSSRSLWQPVLASVRSSHPATKVSDNVTGISDLPPGVSERRLLLLREAVRCQVRWRSWLIALILLAPRSARNAGAVARPPGFVKEYGSPAPMSSIPCCRR